MLAEEEQVRPSTPPPVPASHRSASRPSLELVDVPAPRARAPRRRDRAARAQPQVPVRWRRSRRRCAGSSSAGSQRCHCARWSCRFARELRVSLASAALRASQLSSPFLEPGLALRRACRHGRAIARSRFVTPHPLLQPAFDVGITISTFAHRGSALGAATRRYAAPPPSRARARRARRSSQFAGGALRAALTWAESSTAACNSGSSTEPRLDQLREDDAASCAS